ncbi:MAG: hypothetical protein ABI440_03410 [Casimicrobiaceae bacterium]
MRNASQVPGGAARPLRRMIRACTLARTARAWVTMMLTLVMKGSALAQPVANLAASQ